MHKGSSVWRKILAGVAGYIAWWVIGTFGFVSLRVLWHNYASVESAMTFTFSMQIARLLVGLLCSLGAGIIVSLILRQRSIVPWVLGSVLVIQFLPVHFHLWAKFPIWYHAFFLLTMAPVIVLGSRWALNWARQKNVTASQQPG
jgi:hypothetical protein